MQAHNKWEQKRPNIFFSFKWETKESTSSIYIENYRWIITQHATTITTNSKTLDEDQEKKRRRRRENTYTQIDYRRQNNV